MNAAEKQRIAARLQQYCQQVGSQNKAANSLRGVSSSTISQVLNGNWESIADEMWSNIASQIGYDPKEWQTVEIRAYKRCYDTLTYAQSRGKAFGIIGGAGCGKTATLKAYAERNSNVVLLSCSAYWSAKTFFREILRAAGVDSRGMSISEMNDKIVSEFERKINLLIVLDEADKLSDKNLQYFIELYNKLPKRGFILCATHFLEKRMNKGRAGEKMGYEEIWSRIGSNFIKLQVPNSADVAAICKANGITDKADIDAIFNDCDNDLRRVERKIDALEGLKQQSHEEV